MEGTEPRGDERFLPVAIGFAECGTGLCEHDSAGDTRVFGEHWLKDNTADRMPDQDGFRRGDLMQEILQGICERRNADTWKRRRAAISRHIPCDGAIAILEGIQLAAPCPRRAADSMQEHQRPQCAIAGGLIAKTAIPGFFGARSGHAGPQMLSDHPMLAGPRCMKRDILYLKQFS